MSKQRFRYRKIYPFMLDEGMRMQTDLYPPIELRFSDWLKIEPNGILTIKMGYSWDGPSGPAVKSESFMRASLVHDALYQLISEGLLERRFRKAADLTMLRMCKEDGMGFIRRHYCYAAVRVFGWIYA